MGCNVYIEDRYVYPSPLVALPPSLASLGSLCLRRGSLCLHPRSLSLHRGSLRLQRGSLYLHRGLLKTFFASDSDHLTTIVFELSSGSRFSYRSLLHWLATVALRPLASTVLTFRRVVSPASLIGPVRDDYSPQNYCRSHKGRLTSSRKGRLPSTKLL